LIFIMRLVLLLLIAWRTSCSHGRAPYIRDPRQLRPSS